MVSPNSKKRFAIANPAEIVEQAKAAVEAQPYFAGRSEMFEYEYDTDRRVMVVRGCVPTFYLKQMLQTALKKLDSVQGIDNQVSVDISEGIGASMRMRSLS